MCSQFIGQTVVAAAALAAALAGLLSYRLRSRRLRPGCLSTHHSSEEVHPYRCPLSAELKATFLLKKPSDPSSLIRTITMWLDQDKSTRGLFVHCVVSDGPRKTSAALRMRADVALRGWSADKFAQLFKGQEKAHSFITGSSCPRSLRTSPRGCTSTGTSHMVGLLIGNL